MGKPGRAIRAAGWVAVGAIAAGGVATAATTTGASNSKGSSATTTASVVPAATTPNTKPSAAAGKGRAGRLGKLQGRLLHGEFTVEGKDGKPVNVAEQRGTVNAVSPTSITLTSKDGFSRTYVVDSNTRVRVDGKKGTISGVKTGQQAAVVAKVNGSTETAQLVIQRAAK